MTFPAAPIRVVLWRRIMDELSFELAHLQRREAEIEISGLVLIAEQGLPLRVEYRILCDPLWRTRQVEIAQDYSGARRRMALRHDGDGHWQRDGSNQPALEGCLDVDLGITPSTNALPINRLGLQPGDAGEITAAWVKFPDLDIVAAPQSYERLAPTRYRYCSLDSGFTAEIEVDADGLPTDYAGIWRRIAAGVSGDPCLSLWSSELGTVPSN
jgi:hypothetical protein